MALEVKELVVKFTVEEPGTRSTEGGELSAIHLAKLKQEILAESLEKFEELLEKKHDR